MKNHLRMAVFGIVCMGAADAYAQAFNNCVGVASTPNFNSNETRTRFYIDETFGQDMTATTADTTDDGNVSEFEVRAVIKMAAEHWNMESRGAFLEYGGTFNYTGDDDDYYCPSASETTRIYINFQPECKDLATGDGQGDSDGAGCDARNSSGKIWPISGCSRAVRITAYGSWNNDNPVTVQGAGLNWTLENNPGPGERDLEELMVHELGHALNLGHPQTLSSSVESVMDSGDPDRRYLRYWDQECVATQTGGRAVRPWVTGISSTGVWRTKKEVDLSGPNSEKGALANGFWDDTTKGGTGYAPYHSTFGDVYSYISSLGADGYLYPSLLATEWSPNPIHYTSTAFSLPDDTPNWDNQMVSYLWGASTTTTINPPNIKGVASNDNFVNRTVYFYDHCTNASCTTTESMTSHIPLTSAYDPISQRTVFVSVDSSGGEGGEIFVHPGVYGVRNKLRQGSQLSTSISFTTVNNGTYFLSDGTTQSAVGVACADEAFAGGHNCLVAWVDRGKPSMAVHYSYFSVDTSTNSVDWFDRAVIRGGAHSVSHISAGFFADKLWLGYRSTNVGGDGRVMTNDLTDAYSWSSAIDLGANDYVADPPSFGYMPHLSREAGIFWTEVE